MAKAEAIKEDNPDEISLKTVPADGSKGQMKEDGTYYNLEHGADFYFTVPIHLGKCSSSLFYLNSL